VISSSWGEFWGSRREVLTGEGGLWFIRVPRRPGDAARLEGRTSEQAGPGGLVGLAAEQGQGERQRKTPSGVLRRKLKRHLKKRETLPSKTAVMAFSRAVVVAGYRL
jgi:hypothetical protein